MKFLVSRTYSETTPESATEGDFSDTGYVHEAEEYTLRELIDLIKRDGFYREGGTRWLTNGWSTECYRTGTEREENLHIKMKGE
jgi:hypothetical protein